MKKLPDLTGQRFGKLIVLERVWHKGATHWRCQCDCGNEAVVVNAHLVNGYTKSCGCLRKEFCKSDKINRTYIDGRINDRLYHIYYTMLDRCNNPNSTNYKNYGERGIIVCKEWKESYESFRDWSYKNGYKRDLTIDRIDVNGNYEPSNCRWVTMKEQQYNKRDTVYHEINGKRYTFRDLAEKYNIDVKKLRYRYYDQDKNIMVALEMMGVKITDESG